MIIPVLCVTKHGNYQTLAGKHALDLYDKERDAYNYINNIEEINKKNNNNKIIAHPPCQQWSRLRSFAKDDQKEKELAIHCYEIITKYGGILEHPAGSYLWKYMNTPRSKLLSINQSWFGHRAIKRTYLYYNNVKMIEHPITFDIPIIKVENMSQNERNKSPILFCEYLIRCICN